MQERKWDAPSWLRKIRHCGIAQSLIVNQIRPLRRTRPIRIDLIGSLLNHPFQNESFLPMERALAWPELGHRPAVASASIQLLGRL